MPRLDGVEATRRLLATPDAPRVIVLTTFDLDEYAFAAIRAGASAFLLKDAAPPDLLGAIRAVHGRRRRGRPEHHPPAARPLRRTARPGSARRRTTTASPCSPSASVEVLTLIARGRTNGEIATELVVAETTVKTHVGRILAKTGSRDRVQLVVLGYETGLVTP